jgi:hypothetical protein
MTPTDRVSPGGARWCEEHGRFECTKQRTKGRGDCHQPAVRGTASCRNHAGTTLAVARAKGEAVTAWSALAGEPTVDPAAAVLGMLQVAWLRAHLYAELLQAQVAAQGGTATDVPDDLDDVEPGEGGGDGPSTGGLIGHTYAPARGGDGRVVTGEGPRGLVTLEAAERDRVVRFAKTAHDMGIAERQTELAKAQAEMLAVVLRGALGRLDLSPQQLAVAHQALIEELERVSGGAA